MSKLEFKDFTVKYFGYDAAISGVTTTFCDGINVLFASEKGGKTTFLKALAGIVPYQGEVLLDGEDISAVSLKDRDFQMLFDDYALFERHSVRYNLEYPLKLRKVPKVERRNRAEKAAALFDLDLMIDAPVYRLNEWHKVSLVLCRAYLRAARVLLIDNIFSRLDPQSRKEAFLRYLPLFAERGIVIYATDHPEEAAALSKEIKLLSYGYLLQEGSAEQFRNEPETLTAFASFEEYPSLLPCVIGEGALTLFGETFNMKSLALLSENYLGKDGIVALSPKDLSFSEEGFPATVKGRFYRGDEKVFLLQADQSELFVASADDHSIGETLRVAVRSVTGLFDPLNQRSILRRSL